MNPGETPSSATLPTESPTIPETGGDLLEALGRAYWGWSRPAVAMTDRAGIITAWSSGAAVVSAWTDAEVLGRPLGWLRGDEEATPDLVAAAATELVHDTSWRERPDGSRWWADVVVTPLRDADGGLLGFAELAHDRTEEFLQGESRAMADRCLADALRAGQVAVFRQDTELRYTWGASALPTARSRDEVIGRTDADFLPADVAAELTKHKREVLRTGRRVRFELHVHEGDEEGWRDISLAPLVDAEGVVTGLTGVVVNVTERRRASEQLRRSAKRLAEAEALAQIGSWERDLTHGESYWSPGIFALFQLDPQAATPGLETFLEAVHPDDREEVAAVIRQAEAGGGSYEIEHRIIRTDGRVRWLHSRAEVLAPSEDGPLRIAGNARDVTEAHRVGLALRNAADRLDRQAWREPDPLSARLTSRQREILALVADGLSNREIAGRLFISEATVKWHVRQILRALDVSNRAQAVATYLRSRPERR